jgi:hypothetical protein
MQSHRLQNQREILLNDIIVTGFRDVTVKSGHGFLAPSAWDQRRKGFLVLAAPALF